MHYYLFKVKDNIGQEYYVINNQYIGYLGFDSNKIRRILEWSKSGENLKHQYQLVAQTGWLNNGSEKDRECHKFFCNSTRFNDKEIAKFIKNNPDFEMVNDDYTWYEEYYPDNNSSEFYLREIGGGKVIKG